MNGEDFPASVSTPETQPREETEPPSADSIRVLVVCVLAWALPGLGHLAAGRVVYARNHVQ